MKVVSRGVLGLPLLMLGFAIFVVKQREGQPRDLLRQARSLERSGSAAEALAVYDRLVTEHSGTHNACQALWEMASIEYSVMRDTDRALRLFQNLVDSCQGDRLVGQAMLMLADIHEIDLRELERSNQLRRDYVAMDTESARFPETLFKIGDILFKQGRFSQATEAFERLLGLNPGEEIAAQANLRMGAILQLNQDYDRSIGYFEAVTRESGSPEFRLQARLGLIESYEFMEQLSRAVEIARDIQPDEYPNELKNDILMRLNRKKLHFER